MKTMTRLAWSSWIPLVQLLLRHVGGGYDTFRKMSVHGCVYITQTPP